jgi:hypothetical protein
MEKNQKENKKKITLSAGISALLENNLPKPKSISYGEGVEKLSFNVNSVVTIEKRMNTINRSVDLLFTDADNGISGYAYPLYDIALRFGIISCYTDLELPNDVDVMNAMLVYTPIINDIIEIISYDEYARFKRDFDELIDIKKRALLISENIIRKVEVISSLVKKLGRRVKKIDITKALNDIKDVLP